MDNAAIKPSPRIAGVAAYKPSPGASSASLRLDKNEGRAAPSVLAALGSVTLETVSRYPDASRLEAKLAKRVGVDPDGLIVTAGADEALDRICRAILAPGREIILPMPTFELLPRYATFAGGTVVELEWPSGRFPTDEILARVTADTALIMVVTPNNPTGAVASVKDLEALRAGAPHAVMVVDLAYGELADEDLTAASLALPDTLVVGTLSKGWGLAGLRVGYAAGPLRLVDWIRRAGHPYSLSGLSLHVAEAAIDDEAALARYVARVRYERDALHDLLGELGASPQRSQANFVLCRPANPAALCAGLRDRGIVVRGWPNYPSMAPYVRMTCPADEAGFDALVAALREVLA
jgi:histidinol-phosphate aminotransferase